MVAFHNKRTYSNVLHLSYFGLKKRYVPVPVVMIVQSLQTVKRGIWTWTTNITKTERERERERERVGLHLYSAFLVFRLAKALYNTSLHSPNHRPSDVNILLSFPRERERLSCCCPIDWCFGNTVTATFMPIELILIELRGREKREREKPHLHGMFKARILHHARSSKQLRLKAKEQQWQISATWVWELLAQQAEDETNCHISGTLNNYFLHVIHLLLFAKLCKRCDRSITSFWIKNTVMTKMVHIPTLSPSSQFNALFLFFF